MIPETADGVIHDTSSGHGRSIENIKPHGGVGEWGPRASRVAARHPGPEADELFAERDLGLGKVAATVRWRVVVRVAEDEWNLSCVGCTEDWQNRCIEAVVPRTSGSL